MNEFNVLHKNKKIQKSIAIVMFFIMIFSCVPNVFANDDKSLEQASEKAISWLESKQNTDGSYGQYTTKIRDTSIVSEYLKTNNLLTEVVSKAEGWAVDQKASNIDFASYLIDIVNESSKKQELIEYLVAAQNSDGGWGIDVGFESDCFDTILALKALSKHYSLDKGVLLNGLGFLISAQNQDGSWAYTSGGKGTASITAQAILLMNDIAPKYNNYVLTAVNKGIDVNVNKNLGQLPE
ncbi:MAG TPA: terpene cyclase/mutase family protein [Soehngenia sp.]|nr:terpene cyclase/mutase family protein [Soehngenia sp.]